MGVLQSISRLPGAKVILVAATVIGLVAVGYSASKFFKGDTLEDAHYTLYMCSETGKSFRHLNQEGEMPPILSPHSGRNTGYTAELCFWNADGTPKTTPTPVLLSQYVNPSVSPPDPTFCPDCGRLVIGHNPRPTPGGRVPPTRDEFERRPGR